MRSKKKWFSRPQVALLVGGAVLIISLLIFGTIRSFYTNISTGSRRGPTPAPEQTEFGVLLMGYGGGSHEGTYLTDTIMALHINTKTKQAVLVSVPRDTWVRIPADGGAAFYSKINAAYQMGLFPKNYPRLLDQFHGEQGAADLIKGLLRTITGIKTDYYLAIDFAGFHKAVDILGGLDINVQKGFDDYEYPIEGKKDDTCGKDEAQFQEALLIATDSPELAFPCRFEHLHFEKGLTHMDGETALKFVRSRHSAEDGGDFARARRQQEFLAALREKVLSIGFLPKIIPLMNELDDHIRTDAPPELIQKFIGEAGSASQYRVTQVVLSTDNYLKNSVSADRQYILISKQGQDVWTKLRGDIQVLLQGGSLTPSPSAGVMKN
ncbi:MAG: putative transcriptional regulator YvhJ [Microgenomates bacterium OLB22]|nr:MAG: putative transcriptional regulator YvhJ [Microgenomates bacterium OLB22]